MILLTQIGVSIALPIAGSVYVGAYLDKRLSTGSLFLIIGIFLGVFLGITGAYRLISIAFKNKGK